MSKCICKPVLELLIIPCYLTLSTNSNLIWLCLHNLNYHFIQLWANLFLNFHNCPFSDHWHFSDSSSWNNFSCFLFISFLHIWFHFNLTLFRGPFYLIQHQPVYSFRTKDSDFVMEIASITLIIYHWAIPSSGYPWTHTAPTGFFVLYRPESQSSN